VNRLIALVIAVDDMDVILLFSFSGDAKDIHHLVRLHRSRSTRSRKQNKQPDALTGDV
jgi:DNA-binding MurR/RpiR family transcriptional regulator